MGCRCDLVIRAAVLVYPSIRVHIEPFNVKVSGVDLGFIFLLKEDAGLLVLPLRI